VTKWRVESRIYYFDRQEEVVAQRVRVEREQNDVWTRVLETIYWWPAHEGKEWPALVVPVPEWTRAEASGDIPEHWRNPAGCGMVGSGLFDSPDQPLRYAELLIPTSEREQRCAIAAKRVAESSRNRCHRLRAIADRRLMASMESSA
jgi:hypothetical protein